VKALLANKFLWGPITVAFITQVLKVLVSVVKYKKLDIKRLVDMGGLPSSHAASVSALSIMVGLSEGFDSIMFGVVAFFSIIVMYDAAGVRRAAGEQAKILNIILDELLRGHPVSDIRLKELLGHTPLEVLTGALLGGILGWLIWHL